MSTAEGGLVAGFGTDVRRRPPSVGVPAPQRPRSDRWHPMAVFGIVGVVLATVAWLSVALLPISETPSHWRVFRSMPFLEGWVRWDAGWYWGIARHGYFFDTTRQSPVAFFPGYPMAMRLLAPFTGGPLMAGILLTLVSGLTAVTLFYRWCADRLGTRSARTALLVLMLYPFAFYLVGAVYADAFYLAGALGAFTLLDRGQPVLAGVVGAVATATRPVGYALVLGLVLRSLELRGRPLIGTGPVAPGPPHEGSRWRPAGVLLSAVGAGAYAGWLWYRFGNPLAFVSAQGEWGQAPGVETWTKQAAIRALSSFSFDLYHVRILVHAGLALAAIALLPVVVRRLGWAYGAYAGATVLIPILTSADLVGVGRYLLAAFPCFAVAGHLLARRPWVRRPVLLASGVGLVAFTSLFARWNYVS